jgi:hypothetical protein
MIEARRRSAPMTVKSGRGELCMPGHGNAIRDALQMRFVAGRPPRVMLIFYNQTVRVKIELEQPALPITC